MKKLKSQKQEDNYISTLSIPLTYVAVTTSVIQCIPLFNVFLQNIVTADHNCDQHNLLGHNKSHNIANKVFRLRPPGTSNAAMLVTFYPPWLDLF